MDSQNKEKSETQKSNYERAIFAIAVLYSRSLDMDIVEQDDYSKLTPEQKTFAQKIYEETPSLKRAAEVDERMPEETLVKETAELAKERDNTIMMRIVTVGDYKVCDKCAKWQGQTIFLNAVDGSPNLDEAINDGFLHYGCRCSLQELSTDEIPRKKREWMGLNSRPKQVIVSSGCYLNIV